MPGHRTTSRGRFVCLLGRLRHDNDRSARYQPVHGGVTHEVPSSLRRNIEGRRRKPRCVNLMAHNRPTPHDRSGFARTGPYQRRGDADGTSHHASRRSSQALGRQHRVHAHLFRPGADHDPRPRLLLRRHGPCQEHPEHADDELHQHGDHHDPVGALRLLPRLRHGQGFVHRLDLGLGRPQQHRPDGAVAGIHHPDLRLHGLPADVRHHHARADKRCAGGPGEVHGVVAVHRAVGHGRLLPGRALGLGHRRLGVRPRRDRLRRWYGGPHQRGCRGARRDPGHRQARRLQEGPDASAQPPAGDARLRSAVVRLVRIQHAARGSATTTASAR